MAETGSYGVERRERVARHGKAQLLVTMWWAQARLVLVVAACVIVLALLGLLASSTLLPSLLSRDWAAQLGDAIHRARRRAAAARAKARLPVDGLTPLPSQEASLAWHREFPLRVWSSADAGAAGLLSPSIFVCLPCCADPQAPSTLMSAFRGAQAPGRVFVGVVSFTLPRSVAAADVLGEAWRKVQGVHEAHADWARALLHNTRQLVVPDDVPPKGPAHARWLSETHLRREEQFVLFVDSHTEFAPQWDTQLLAELAECPDAHRTVLTAPPDTFDPQDRAAAVFTTPPRRFTAGGWEHGSSMLMWGSVPFDGSVPVPPLTCGFAGACAFMPAAVLGQVPYLDGDADVPWLFFGEEAAMAARLFTHGIDLRSPRRNFVLTVYDRSYREVDFGNTQSLSRVMTSATAPATASAECGQGENLPDPAWVAARLASEAAVRSMLGMAHGRPLPAGQGGETLRLGTLRSLEQFQRYVGVDFATQAILPRGGRGEVDPGQMMLFEELS
jgi:hypothetical protein